MLLSIIILHTIFTGSVASENGSSVKHIHPFLFFNQKDVYALRERAQSTHAKMAQRISLAAQNMMQNPESFLPEIGKRSPVLGMSVTATISPR